jgi:hypothetical protein
MNKITESDWKKLRSLKDDALDLACERIFEKIKKITDGRKGQEHKAYLNLWKLIKSEDHEISIMFDDLKRSNAFYKLAAWRLNNVISAEDFSEFSDETKQAIELLMGINP